MKSLPLTAWKRVKNARKKRKFMRHIQTLSVGLLAFALGGLFGPYIPTLRLESQYRLQTHVISPIKNLLKPQSIAHAPESDKPTVTINPLKNEDGSIITPVDAQFGLIVPKVGINATVLPNVNPADPKEYNKALLKGIAHASTSYMPDQDGTVFLFSHSTNYDWFVHDLNAVFYLLKNLSEEDKVILMYKGVPYTYKITGKHVVSPAEISYLVPETGVKRLILQTCWPPGSTTERLLIFADYVESL